MVALGILFVFAAQNSAVYGKINAVESSRDIPLRGQEESSPGFRSIIASITAEQYDDRIVVSFQSTVGVVQVTITCEYGEEVFTTTVDAVTQSSLTISLMGVPSGNYIIAFSGSKVEMTGEFAVW